GARWAGASDPAVCLPEGRATGMDGTRFRARSDAATGNGRKVVAGPPAAPAWRGLVLVAPQDAAGQSLQAQRARIQPRLAAIGESLATVGTTRSEGVRRQR